MIEKSYIVYISLLFKEFLRTVDIFVTLKQTKIAFFITRKRRTVLNVNSEKYLTRLFPTKNRFIIMITNGNKI